MSPTFQRFRHKTTGLALGFLVACWLAVPALADDGISIGQSNGQAAIVGASCTGGTLPSGSPKVCTITEGGSVAHISTSTTTTVKSGAGFLHSITVNTKGTSASVVTVYDKTTAAAPIIAIIDSLNLSGTFTFDVAFATGLTIVTTGAPDLTVSYR